MPIPATTGTLSPHILPIADLKQMLSHIEESLPTTMHLPVSSEDTLHFYRYLHTHILIAYRQFLLLIDVPVTSLYTKNATSIAARCSLQVRKAQTISIPTWIAPNIWLLTSAPSTVTTRITLVCHERTY